MGCLYWMFIGWWWEPAKWLAAMQLKILYWIYIGWWFHLITDPEYRMWFLRIVGCLILLAIGGFLIYWWCL